MSAPTDCDFTSSAWLTCSQIAEQWESVSVRRVASVAAYIGIRPGAHLRAGFDGLDEYSPAAVGLIELELLSRGHERAEDIPFGEEEIDLRGSQVHSP